MDIEKFTERSRGFLQAAQTIAMREFNQRLTPEHLLKAHAGRRGGGGGRADPRRRRRRAKAVQQANDAEVARLPKVQGQGAGQPAGDAGAASRAGRRASRPRRRPETAIVAQDRRAAGARRRGDAGRAGSCARTGPAPATLDKRGPGRPQGPQGGQRRG